MMTVTRFAPSPTGYLHIGHVYAALVAWRAAEEAGGHCLLRIEDIDAGRCRPHFEDAIYKDLAWLGLSWPQPVRRQSDHMAEYGAALDRLAGRGLVYPCFCTRADIRAEIERADGAPHGTDGALYPGTCRDLLADEGARRIAAGESHALRLHMVRAAEVAGTLSFHDRGCGTVTADPLRHGDVVLARKDTPASYHLAVTLDDHLQKVTLVTRGEDLLAATDIHRLLQALLGLDTPDYHHHRLLTDGAGRRFAKRDGGLTVRALRDAGNSPDDVRNQAWPKYV